MKSVFTTLLLLLLFGRAANQSLQPTKVLVNGVELHYVEQGQGEPLIFLHGGSGDYRAWEPQLKAFSSDYHVISYSRRYNYPNQNPVLAKNHSAYVEADDLAALIHKLKLRRVHLVDVPYGAFTALALALKRPELVRSLVLSGLSALTGDDQSLPDEFGGLYDRRRRRRQSVVEQPGDGRNGPGARVRRSAAVGSRSCPDHLCNLFINKRLQERVNRGLQVTVNRIDMA